MKKKDDEENFDEAYSLAYKAWATTSVPSDIEALLKDPQANNLTAKVLLYPLCQAYTSRLRRPVSQSDPFWYLVHALNLYVAQPPHVLPLCATLPDMKSDTKSYIHLQNLYKTQANEDRARFSDLLRGVEAGWAGGAEEKMEGIERSAAAEALSLVDDFVKNAHGLKVLRGKRWMENEDIGQWLRSVRRQGQSSSRPAFHLASVIDVFPASLATHLAISAVFAFQAKHSRLPRPAAAGDTAALTEWVRVRLVAAGWKPESGEDVNMAEADDEEIEGFPKELSLWQHVENAVGEV